MAVPFPAKPRDDLGELLAGAKPEDVSWYDVGALAGTSKSAIEQWLSGRTKDPPLRAVLRVARLLGVPLEALEQAAIGPPTEDAAAARGEALDAVRRRLEARAAENRAARSPSAREGNR